MKTKGWSILLHLQWAWHYHTHPHNHMAVEILASSSSVKEGRQSGVIPNSHISPQNHHKWGLEWKVQRVGCFAWTSWPGFDPWVQSHQFRTTRYGPKGKQVTIFSKTKYHELHEVFINTDLKTKLFANEMECSTYAMKYTAISGFQTILCWS